MALSAVSQVLAEVGLPSTESTIGAIFIGWGVRRPSLLRALELTRD